jgi:hypothetical protein
MSQRIVKMKTGKPIKTYKIIADVDGTNDLDEVVERFERQLKALNISAGNTRIKVSQIEDIGQSNAQIDGRHLKYHQMHSDEYKEYRQQINRIKEREAFDKTL